MIVPFQAMAEVDACKEGKMYLKGRIEIKHNSSHALSVLKKIEKSIGGRKLFFTENPRQQNNNTSIHNEH